MNDEFKKVPFPHVLRSRGSQLRFVSDQDINQGGELREHSHIQRDPMTGDLVAMQRTWIINKIIEKRPAKGDWSNWPKRPTYYEADATWIGLNPATHIPLQ